MVYSGGHDIIRRSTKTKIPIYADEEQVIQFLDTFIENNRL